MGRANRRGFGQHTSDEFGKTGLGSASAVGDRGLGAAAGVVIDGIVERESGQTPGPSAPYKTIVLVLVGMLLGSIAIIGVWTALAAPKPLPAGAYTGIWASLTSDRPVTEKSTFEFMADSVEDEAVTVWRAQAQLSTVCVVDGEVVSLTDFAGHLRGGAWRVDVIVSAPGVIDRMEMQAPDVAP